MSLRPVVIEQFPGLDLRQDPGDARGAIDALNVTFSGGRVRSRDGSSTFFSTSFPPVFLGRFRRGAGIDHLIVADTGNNVFAVDQSGVMVASAAIPAVDVGGATGVGIGTPSGALYYVGNRSALTSIRRWDGATWTSPAAFAAMSGTLGALVSLPVENRLVLCYDSTVKFSNPGAPEVFSTNDFVSVSPGDGEQIQGAAVFGNQLFVFKQSKFFVFYGSSVDSTGNPVFNYRTVDTGVGMALHAPQSVTTGVDGVYFLGSDSVFRTTGGAPTRYSLPVNDLIQGSTGSFWAGAAWTQATTAPRVAWCNGVLYLSNGAALMNYDTALNAWSAWSLGTVGAMIQFPPSPSSTFETLFVADKAANRVVRVNPAVTTDVGTAIVSRYRLPFETYGAPGQKRLRETILEGVGAPTVQWSRDWGALVTGSAVTLGTSPAIAVGRQRLAIRGRALSLQLGAASGAWSVNRVQANVADAVRPAGVTV